MIRITPTIAIDEAEIQEEFIHASGAGGQNVNKVATAVQLRFDVIRSPSLPKDVRERLIRLAGRRITEDGILVIQARRFRAQKQNREDAVARLVAMIRKAAVQPKPRRPTRPTLASKKHRLDSKRRHSNAKKRRRPVADHEDS